MALNKSLKLKNKISLTIFLGIVISFTSFSQSCLPEGITFTTQEQIDNFYINYPNCTEIEGDVTIQEEGYDHCITDLGGLSVLTSIGGDLYIYDNYYLASLTGLNNLISINGILFIGEDILFGNPSLNNLTGLESLSFIGSSFIIRGNGELKSLSGLDSLAFVGGDLWIDFNPALENLSGLTLLDTVVDELYIAYNDSLTSLSGLEALTFAGNIYISDNPALANVAGLEGLTSFNGDFYLGGSDALSNLTGLENLVSVGGYLWFNDNALTSLEGLNNLNYIGGDLAFISNDNLTNLIGLDALAHIGGDLIFSYDDAIVNFVGLNALNSIGGDLRIQYCNTSLNSLTGLENVTYLEDDILIRENNALRSLSGLDNIAAGSIREIFIYNNDSLSTCNVQSICDYLANPNGTVEIHDNSPGCNSQEEVEAACEVGLDETRFTKNQFSIYPNPSFSSITIEDLDLNKNSLLSVFNMNGQELKQQWITEPTTVIEISHLPAGVYIIGITSEDRAKMFKLVKY